MTRYYMVSIIIHLFFFMYAQSLQDSHAEAKSPMDKSAVERKTRQLSQEKVKKIIKDDMEEREQKLDEIFKVIKKHRPELEKKKIRNFADLVISSELEENDLQKITEDNLSSRLKEYSKKDISVLKNDLNRYLRSSDHSSGPKEGGSPDSATDKNGEQLAGGRSSGNGLGRSGSGGLLREKDEGYLDEGFGSISYKGHGIDHKIKEHSVSSEEHADLESRDLTKLKIEESIAKAVELKELLGQISEHKPSKYALLPEPPIESRDTLDPSQIIDFKSLSIGYAPRMNEEFVPDGNLDEWDLSQPMTPINAENSHRFHADIYLAWDLENIYLAARIDDPYKIKRRANRWWTSNSLEVWFDILNNKSYQKFDSDDFQFWFTPYRPYFGKALGSHKFLSRTIPKKVKPTENGYVVEAAFRQNEELRYLRSYLGKTLGFHFFVNTSQKARDGYERRLFWVTDKYVSGRVHTYTWANPNSWGDVVFMGSVAKLSIINKEGTVKYKHFGINEWNRISIQDADRNLDPKTRQLVKIILHSRMSLDIEEMILTETENNSGKFVGTIFSNSLLAKENDGFLQTSSGEAVDMYYHDQFTPNGISHLLKKTYFTYYPIMILSSK